MTNWIEVDHEAGGVAYESKAHGKEIRIVPAMNDEDAEFGARLALAGETPDGYVIEFSGAFSGLDTSPMLVGETREDMLHFADQAVLVINALWVSDPA